MPVVRKISTRASARDAYTAPFPMPIMTWVRNTDIATSRPFPRGIRAFGDRRSVHFPPCSAPEVRAAYVVVAEQLVGSPGCDDRAGLEHVAPLGDTECEVGVLLDDEHRHTVVPVDFAERPKQPLGDD